MVGVVGRSRAPAARVRSAAFGALDSGFVAVGPLLRPSLQALPRNSEALSAAVLLWSFQGSVGEVQARGKWNQNRPRCAPAVVPLTGVGVVTGRGSDLSASGRGPGVSCFGAVRPFGL